MSGLFTPTSASAMFRISDIGDRIQTKIDGFKLKRQAMNPQAHHGAEKRLRLHYAKNGGKIVDTLYARGVGPFVYASRNPPWWGCSGKASRNYLNVVGSVARELRAKGREGGAQATERLATHVMERPATARDADQYGATMRALNSELSRAATE